MEVTVERTGPCEAKVSFTVPRAEFDGEVRRQLSSAARNVKMKGFRPGKVPPKVLEKHFGAEARQRAMESYFNQAFQKAVEQESLKTVGHERVSLDDLELAEGADFAHSFEVSLRPEFELGEYKGLSVESELEPVLDQEVEAALEDLKRQRAHPEPAGDEGLPEDGMALVRIVWESGDETLLDRDGLRITPLDPLPGVEQQAFHDAILGVKDGDTVELDLLVPDDFEEEQHRGKQGKCRVEVGETYRMVPPGDEEVFELLGVEDAEALQVEVRQRIAKAKESREQSRVEGALLERVLDAHEMDLPERMVDSQIETRLQQLQQQLVEQQGLSEEDAKTEVEQSRDEARKVVEKGVKAYFLVQAIAEREELKLQNEDFVAELQAIAQRHGATYEQVRDFYRERGLIEQVAIELLERKVRQLLRESAQITEPS